MPESHGLSRRCQASRRPAGAPLHATMSIAFGLAVGLAFGQGASAVDRVWVGSPPGDGVTFVDALNWSPLGVPSAADRAIFDDVGGTISLPGGLTPIGMLLIGGPTLQVIFELSGGLVQLVDGAAIGDARSLIVASAAGDNAEFTVRDGTLLGAHGVIGATAGAIGHLTIENDAAVTLLGVLQVGESGTGSVAVDGELLTAEAVLGAASGASGGVLVDGGAWIVAGDLTFGAAGIGNVEAIGGGLLVVSGNAVAATEPGGDAELIVSGPATVVLVVDDAAVGGDTVRSGGTATLTSEDDGLLRIGGLLRAWPSGSIVVADARLEATELNVIGGALSILGAGAVAIGGGSATVAGLAVGVGGNAVALVSDGGVVTMPSAVVGPEPGTEAELHLDAALMEVAGELRLGWPSTPLSRNTGAGTLRLRNGATVTADLLSMNQQGVLDVDGGALAAGSAQLSDEGSVVVPFRPDEASALVADSATLRGALLVALDGPTPTIDQRRTVISATTMDGEFAVIRAPLLPAFRRIVPERVSDIVEALDLVVELLPVAPTLRDPTSTTLIGPPAAVALGNFDNDGNADAAVTIPLGPTRNGVLQLLASTVIAPGDLPDYSEAATVEVGVDPGALALGDLDGNGQSDVVVSNRGDGTLTIVRVLATPLAGFEFDVETIQIGGSPGGLAVALLDADGAPDVAVVDSANDLLLVLFGDGVGGLSEPLVIETGSLPRGVCPIDLDNDKDLDLVVVNFGVATPSTPAEAASVAVHRNLRSAGGGFAPPEFHEVGRGAVALADGDLDGDGFADAVTANSLDQSISILRNDGVGSFLPAVDLPVFGVPSAIALADLDDDGDLDIAVLVTDDEGEPQLRVYRNDTTDGDLTLTLITEAQSLFGLPAAFTAADADLDGITDLVVVGALAGGVRARASDRGGAAGASGFISVLVAEPVTCPSDLNGDGVVDGADLGIVLTSWGGCFPPR